MMALVDNDQAEVVKNASSVVPSGDDRGNHEEDDWAIVLDSISLDDSRRLADELVDPFRPLGDEHGVVTQDGRLAT